MKELTLFYLPDCPHCKLALRYLEELKREDPRFDKIPVRMINERVEKELANSYNYWYVPCFFLDGQNLHEGHAERTDVQQVLEQALQA